MTPDKDMSEVMEKVDAQVGRAVERLGETPDKAEKKFIATQVGDEKPVVTPYENPTQAAVERFKKEFIEKNYWKSDNEDTAFVAIERFFSFLTTEITSAYERGVADERRRVVEVVEGQVFEMNVDEYVKKVDAWDGRNYDVAFDNGYYQAITDLKERLTNLTEKK